MLFLLLCKRQALVNKVLFECDGHSIPKHLLKKPNNQRRFFMHSKATVPAFAARLAEIA